jgi:ribonuclease D
VAPPLTDTDDALAALLPALAASPGPVAVDTERASGFTYSGRAYLIQLKTVATGILLLDPIPLSASSLAGLAQALNPKEWVLHAASQDLPALRELGLDPARLFDTELAARLLGRPRVGLGPLLEDVVDVTLAKDHGNSDWSERPLPDDWLSYAAGDVEFLIELADTLKGELVAAGKADWAVQEFDHVLTQPPPAPKPEPWRSTTDIHLVHTRRGLATVRAIWEARDAIARDLDLAPHRVVKDRAIAALAARVTETSTGPGRAALQFREWRRGAARDYPDDFRAAIAAVDALEEADLPSFKAPRGEAAPSVGLWARKNPAAARRWRTVRPVVRDLAESLTVPMENLVAPRALRNLLWDPAGLDPASIEQQLAAADVRPWQRALLGPVIADALTTV